MSTRLVIGAGTAALCIAIPMAAIGAQEVPEREITLVGCVMTEAEYRSIYGPGLSGPRGPGIGLRDEYMLVDAQEIADPTLIPADELPCPEVGTTFPNAYELTGSREEEIAEYVGQRVVLTGIREEADVRAVGTTGVLRPTGGFDPLGHELHLFEVEVERFRSLRAVLAEAAPPPPVVVEPAPAPEIVEVEPAPAAPPVAAAPPPPPPAPEPQIVEEPAPRVARVELPRTASPLPLAGLIGLLSLGAAAALRTVRNRG